MKKLYLVVFFIVVCSFSKGYALPLNFLHLYGTGGVSMSPVKITNITLFDGTEASTALPDVINKNNSYNFAVGISNDYPILIIGGLRPQVEFGGTVNGDITRTFYGAGLYYDLIKVIPLFKPYIGASFNHVSGKYKMNFSGKKIFNPQSGLPLSNREYDIDPQVVNHKFSADIMIFHAGLEMKVPTTSLSLYANYDYYVSIASPKLNTETQYYTDNNGNKIAYHFSAKDFIVKSGVELGLKYYLL